jgi:hypothetical protein
MRSLTDQVIQDFIEKHKGCAMSIDAVLDRIGSTLPTQFPHDRSDDPLLSQVDTINQITLFPENIPLQYNPSPSSPKDLSFQNPFVGSDDLSRYKRINKKDEKEKKKTCFLNKHMHHSFSLPLTHTISATISPSSSISPEIQVNHRPSLSRGAGFRSPNSKYSKQFSSSSFLRSENLTSPSQSRPTTSKKDINDEPSPVPSPIANLNETIPPSPSVPRNLPESSRLLEDSLSLDSLSLPVPSPVSVSGNHPSLSIQKQRPSPTIKGAKGRGLHGGIGVGRPLSGAGGEREIPGIRHDPCQQDLTPAPVPRDPKKNKQRGKNTSVQNNTERIGYNTRPLPLSTTDYGGLYSISSYKNVLDPDYLANL